MKKILLNIIFCFSALLATGQSVYEILPEPVCWYISEQDSSLTRYIMVSSRTPGQISILGYVNSAGEVVDVSAGGFFTDGFCDCCNGNGSGGGDQDWAFVVPGMETILNPIYRFGKVSINTTDTTHLFRSDGTFQFNPAALTTFDWQDLTDTTGTNYRGLLFRAPGTFSGTSNLSGGSNNFTLAINSTPTDRLRLGAYAFAGKFPSQDDFIETAWMEAYAEGDWNSTNRGTSINFWVTDTTNTFNTMTLEKGGRLELDRYGSFDDGTPLSLLGYNSVSKDVTRHFINGTPSPGNVLILNDSGDLSWIDTSAISGGGGTTNLTEGLGAIQDTTFSSTGTPAIVDRDIQYTTPPTPATDRDKSTIYVDPADDRARVYDPGISDYSLSRLDYTIGSVTEALSLTAPNGVQLELRSTNAKYITQSSVVSGYTTDSIAVIPLAGGNYAVLQDRGGTVKIEDFGFVVGAGQNITTQKSNFTKLKRATLWAQLKDVDILFPGDTLEFFPTPGQAIDINEGEYVAWIGAGRDKTILDCKPDWPIADNNGLIPFFTSTNEHDLLVQDMTVRGPTQGPAYEAYASVLRYGGDSTKIKIQDAITIRSGFWAELEVGDTMWYQAYNQAPFYMTSVAAKDSATRVITLTNPITDGTIAPNDSTSTSYAIFYWKANSNPDSVSVYSKRFVLGISGAGGFNFNPGQQNYSRKGELKFKNVAIHFFTGAIVKSGGGEDLVLDNCYVYRSISSGISCFPGEYPNPSKLILLNSTIDSCATNMDGTGAPNSGGYGHNLYIHPNVPMEWYGSQSIRSNGYALHVYSGSGNKPAAPGAKTIIENSYFANSDEPVILNWDLPTKVINTTFSNTGGSIWVANNTEFDNVVFDSVAISSNPGYDPPNDIKGGVDVVFNNCKFINSGRISGISWSTSASSIDFADLTNRVIIKDCVWEINEDKTTAIISGPQYAKANSNNPELIASNIRIDAKGHYFRLLTDWPRATLDNINIVNPSTSSSGIIRSSSTYNNNPYKIIIKDSNLSGLGSQSVFDSGADVESDVRLYNTTLRITSSTRGLSQVESFAKKQLKTSISANSITLKTSYDSYFVNNSGDIRSVLLDSIYPKDLGRVSVNITCGSDSIRFIPYQSLSTSNLYGSDTLVLYKGESTVINFVPFPLGNTPNVDTLLVGIGNGSTTRYLSSFPNAGFDAFKKIPGTVRIVTSSIDLSDNGDNIVSGTGIKVGKVSYVSKRYYIEFDTAPTASDSIFIIYTKYDSQDHYGYWNFENPLSDPGISGSGTTDYNAIWTNSTELGTGSISDNGTGHVGVGTTFNSNVSLYAYQNTGISSSRIAVFEDSISTFTIGYAGASQYNPNSRLKYGFLGFEPTGGNTFTISVPSFSVKNNALSQTYISAGFDSFQAANGSFVIRNFSGPTVRPGTDQNYDLGTSSIRWKDLYFGGTLFSSGYGTGSKEASDLSKTESIYQAVFATDGTLLDKRTTSGTVSGTPDGSGDLTVTHGLGTTPTIVLLGPKTANNYTYYWHSEDGTNFKIHVADATTGVAITAGTVAVSWEAK